MNARARMTGIFGWLDDRANPIVVKEARQAVRSAVVATALLLLLTILLLATTTVVVYDAGGVSRDQVSSRGFDLFWMLNGIMMVVCTLFVPVYSAVRLSGERTGPAADLLYVTTIRPSSVVWGKLLVASMITILFFSLAAPFLVFTYLFRGIDLFTIVVVILIELIIVIAASQIGVFLASLPISGVLRALLGITLAPFVIFSLIGIAESSSDYGISATALGVEGWLTIGITLFVVLLVTGMLFCLSVAACSPGPSNRAALPRLYATLCWIVSFGVVVYLCLGMKWIHAVDTWHGLWTTVGSIGILLSLGERREIGARVRTALPRSVLGRFFAFFFTSGAAPGMLWAFALIGLTCVSAIVLVLSVDMGATRSVNHYLTMLTFPAWVAAYGLMAVGIRDYLLRDRAGSEMTIPITIGLSSLGALLPAVVAFLISPERWDRVNYHLYTNVVGVTFLSSDNSARFTMLTVAVATMVVLMVAMSSWFTMQFAQFRRLAPVKGVADVGV